MKTSEIIVIFATTSTTVTIYVTGFGLIVMQSSPGNAFGLRLTDKFQTI